jgi:hypothetical protein
LQQCSAEAVHLNYKCKRHPQSQASSPAAHALAEFSAFQNNRRFGPLLSSLLLLLARYYILLYFHMTQLLTAGTAAQNSTDFIPT